MFITKKEEALRNLIKQVASDVVEELDLKRTQFICLETEYFTVRNALDQTLEARYKAEAERDELKIKYQELLLSIEN